jgi:formylglycine-generating enzyme required for sulfatase activity
MVVVPAGEFMMGFSPSSELDPLLPQPDRDLVRIAKPFAVGRFAVTFDEWDGCVGSDGCGGYRPSDEGWGRDRRPVINVSWDDAKSYVAWLSKTTGKPYRLLSDVEREYVTRAGTTTPFWWGKSITTEQANYDPTFCSGPKGCGLLEKFYPQDATAKKQNKTVPVDSFKPNAWGLYQIHGNIWEWVEDCSENCSRRIRQGGAWNSNAFYLRADFSRAGSSASRTKDTGFRVARTLGT